MIQFFARLLVVLVFLSLFPFANHASAQTESRKDPYYREAQEASENALIDTDPNLSAAELDQLALNQAFAIGSSAITGLESSFGYINDKGEFVSGSLGKLKLKPSDKQRLIKLANGSLTEQQKKTVMYDERLMQLLTKLVTPKELGGAGLEHLRVADLLRFRQDPRSRETENSDSISQHQFGKAADIVEIGKANCTKESLFGSEDLPPFPVKVIWQGGGPYNPSVAAIGAFDAVARANAFRDILGALPGESYNGAIQGLEDLLQQLQRRVIASELGLPLTSLDYVVNNDLLETLGQVATSQKLGYATGALRGSSTEDITRSLPQAALEQTLSLPPGSLKGDDWNSTLERLGRYKVAYDTNTSVDELLSGKTDTLKNNPYYTYYAQAEAAYRLPAGTLEGIKANRADAFRQIGAQLIADRLHYSSNEQKTLIDQAKTGSVKQLSLARFGGIPSFPGNVLLMLAPADGSSKKAGELYLGQAMLGSKDEVKATDLPDPLRGILEDLPGIGANSSGDAITNALAKNDKRRDAFRRIGAAYMEEVFDLPETSLSEVVARYQNPTRQQFEASLGQKLKATQVVTTADSAANVGKTYLETTFTNSFADLYHVPTVGLARISLDDQYALLLGQTNEAATRAGASWVEEDLGLTPGSFSVLFTSAGAEERLVNAGVAVLGGELFEAFDINAQDMTSGDTFKTRVGQARIETALGLTPGSFRDSRETIQQANADRYDTIFATPGMVDTIAGLPAGTTRKLLDNQIKPHEVSQQAGDALLSRLDTETLHEKLGWDNRYEINGQDLLAAINANDGSLRGHLAKIGSFNTDVALGYDPETIQRWAFAGSEAEKNNILVAQGGKLYADRLGVNLDHRDDILDAYRTNNSQLKSQVVNKIKDQLERSAQGQSENVLVQASKKVILEQLDSLEDTAFQTSGGTEHQQIEEAKQLLQAKNANTDTLTTIRDSLGSLAQSVGDTALKTAITTTTDRISTELNKIATQINPTGRGISIPASDVLSFVNGDMSRAYAVLVAARQATTTPVDFDDPYQLFMLLSAGSSSNPSYEQALSQLGSDLYTKVLADAGIAPQAVVLDQVYDYITKGVLTPTGGFNPNQSPYSDALLSNIRFGYFATKEARNTYFYGLIDAQIQQRDPNLPDRFSETLLEGSFADRSTLLLDYLGSKLGDNILASLPSDLQPTVQSFLQSYNPETGKVLISNTVFTDWASSTMSNYIGASIPPAAVSLAVRYATQTFDPKILSAEAGTSPAEAQANNQALIALGAQALSEWVGKAMGLPTGQFAEYYAKYQQIQILYKSYQSGNLDAGTAILAADQLLFDGKIAELTQSIDDALGLPGGSSQLLIQFALTQNPIYLFQFVFNIFFGSTVECPDLQQEAQRNVKKLIRAIVNLGQSDAAIIPSQIITFKSSYLEDLKDKIAQNYFVCEPGSRCGVFARPEYARQVHIGF